MVGSSRPAARFASAEEYSPAAMTCRALRSTQASACPLSGAGRAKAMTNRDWWPDQLNLKVLHQNPPAGDPMGEDFDYAEAFSKLDYAALKADLAALRNAEGMRARVVTLEWIEANVPAGVDPPATIRGFLAAAVEPAGLIGLLIGARISTRLIACRST